MYKCVWISAFWQRKQCQIDLFIIFFLWLKLKFSLNLVHTHQRTNVGRESSENKFLVHMQIFHIFENELIHLNRTCVIMLALVPGSLPSCVRAMTHAPDDHVRPLDSCKLKSGREPGIFYHVSNVFGRETVERRLRDLNCAWEAKIRNYTLPTLLFTYCCL